MDLAFFLKAQRKLPCVCVRVLTVIVRRAEGVVGHAPARWEDDKVGDGHTGSRGLGRQHREDGGILWHQHGWVQKQGAGGLTFVKALLRFLVHVDSTRAFFSTHHLLLKGLTAWSKATQLITMKSFRLYLYGV